MSCRCRRFLSCKYQLTLSLRCVHSVGQQTSSGLGSGGPGLFGPYNRNKCFLGLTRLTSPPSCILISSKPAQGPRNPWPAQASIQYKQIYHYSANGCVRFEAQGKFGNTLHALVHFWCIRTRSVRCRFVLLGLWMVNFGLWEVYKLTRFTFPQCWTGIEKEIVYIEMLNTRHQLFFPPVFTSLQRHDPFKWLFTCIRRRAKALLNEVLSTIQLEWTSQQHNFPLSTMLTSAEQNTGRSRKSKEQLWSHLQPPKAPTCLWIHILYLCLRYCPM